MADERNDRRYGYSSERDSGRSGADRGSYGEQGGYRERGYAGRDEQRDRSGAGRDYGRDPRGYQYSDRGFFDRAGDEVRSWFGDEDAERRRQADDRYAEREDARGYGRDQDYGRGGYGREQGRDEGYGRSAFDRDRNAGYGASYGSGNSFAGDYGRSQGTRDMHEHGYRSWRDKQMDSFDRDYDEYRREHQSRFDSEFKAWREGRQGQRDLLAKVQEHAEVVGSDGQHVGTVDHVRGDQIELTKNDKDAGGRHHLIPSSWLSTVEGTKVMLSKTADQAKQHWRDEARDAGGQNDRGRYGMNRSFSGTY